MIFTSGQMAREPGGQVGDPTSVAGQTRVVMENIRRVLAEFGATTEDVLRKNTYYAQLDGWRETVPIRAEYFRDGVAVSGVVVDLVWPELRIEMDVVAMVDE